MPVIGRAVSPQTRVLTGPESRLRSVESRIRPRLPMPNPPTGLDADLLAEFAATARLGYADLLAALARVTHPAEEQDNSPTDPILAAGRLAECWRTACTMSAPAANLADHFPLADPGAVTVLDNLLALAAYSSVPVERAESVGALVHSLASAAQSISATGSGSDSTFQPD